MTTIQMTKEYDDGTPPKTVFAVRISYRMEMLILAGAVILVVVVLAVLMR